MWFKIAGNSSVGVSGLIHCALQCLYEIWTSQRHWSLSGSILDSLNSFYDCWLWVTSPPVFIAPADCSTNLNYSCHDFAGVCNVESIQMDHVSSSAHSCATGHCFRHTYRGHRLRYLKYVLDGLRISCQSHPGFPSSPVTLLPSHGCPSAGFLPLRYVMEQFLIQCCIWTNPTICSRGHAGGSCCYSNIEAVNWHVQSDKAVAA